MSPAMSPRFHPNLLQTRNYSIPEDQQRLLEKQAVNRETAVAEHELPRGVVASIKAHADRLHRKRDAHEASLTPDTRVNKAAKTSHAIDRHHAQSSNGGSAPSTPMITRRTTANMDPAPPLSSPATVLSWSPSPVRDTEIRPEMAPPTKAIPSKLPAPSFPSSVLEEPLEVELPRAQLQPPPTASGQSQAHVDVNSSHQSQADTPFLRGKACAVDTPPCGQPSRSMDSERNPPRTGLRSIKSLGWPTRPNSKPKGFDKDRKRTSHVSPDKADSPFRSSIPSSSYIIPASIQPPPAGQSIPHPAWPPPRQPPPDDITSIPRLSGSSQDIIGMTQGTGAEASQSGQGHFPPVQTMSYISPDIFSSASQPEVSEAQPWQPEALQVGIVQATVSRIEPPQDPGLGANEQEVEREALSAMVLPGAGKVPIVTPQGDLLRTLATTTTAVPEESGRARSSTIDHTLSNDRERATKVHASPGEVATTSQDVSATSAASAIPATQKPEKLFISFDEGSDSPFETFCKAYPVYSGSLPQFVKACICLEYMARKKTLHQSLYDDFVGAFPAYLIYNKNTPRGEVLVAADWYNDRDEDVLYGKRIIDKQNLKGILGYYDAEVQQQQKSITSRGPRKPSSELESVRSTPVAIRQQFNCSPQVERESSEKGPLNDTRVIANTQTDDSELHKTRAKSSNPAHLDSAPSITKTQAKEISPPPTEQKKSSVGRFDAPRDIVAKTPATKSRQASDPPLTLPKTASAVPAKLSKDKAAQRHSTGALQGKTKQPTSQAKPQTSGPKPCEDATAYFARLTRPRNKEDEQRFSGFGRKQNSGRSSLSRSDAS